MVIKDDFKNYMSDKKAGFGICFKDPVLDAIMSENGEFFRGGKVNLTAHSMFHHQPVTSTPGNAPAAQRPNRRKL